MLATKIVVGPVKLVTYSVFKFESVAFVAFICAPPMLDKAVMYTVPVLDSDTAVKEVALSMSRLDSVAPVALMGAPAMPDTEDTYNVPLVKEFALSANILERLAPEQLMGVPTPAALDNDVKSTLRTLEKLVAHALSEPSYPHMEPVNNDTLERVVTESVVAEKDEVAREDVTMVLAEIMFADTP